MKKTPSISRKDHRAKANQHIKAKSKVLQAKDYRRYMSSKDWRAKKKYYWSRCKDKSCRGCLEPWRKGFHLHHRTYVRLGAERLADLLPMCQGCHNELHLFQSVNNLNVEEATTKWLRMRGNENKIRTRIGDFDVEARR